MNRDNALVSRAETIVRKWQSDCRPMVDAIDLTELEKRIADELPSGRFSVGDEAFGGIVRAVFRLVDGGPIVYAVRKSVDGGYVCDVIPEGGIVDL